MHLKYRSTCRVCGSQLVEVLDLGDQYLQGSFVKGNIKPSLRKISMKLGFCDPSKTENACGLVQLMHTVPPQILYSHYWYRSGTNSTMKKHLASIAKDIVSSSHHPVESILDIGCNDGTFLEQFPPSVHRVGIDPSNAIESVPPGIETLRQYFPSSKLIGEHFDVITAFAMMYDLENPVEFLREVKQNLTKNGVFVFEVAYLPTMMKNLAFDSICHEHIEYYSLSTLETLLSKVGMVITDARLTDTNCGSILCFASISGQGITTNEINLNRIRENEFSLSLDDLQTYYRFASLVYSRIEDISSLIRTLSNQGSTIHIYGSSTKGNVLIQAAGLHEWIRYAADRNQDKHGAFTLGTNISIISEEESRAESPDYYLVLPWHFRIEFLEREKEALRNGTKFIFPFPELEIIGKDGPCLVPINEGSL